MRTIKRAVPHHLAILISVFIVLAVLYSLIIPLFEGPDEDDHFRYARYLALNRNLPVQHFETGGGEAGHQGWQPPLYYALASLIIAPIDTSDFSQHLRRNPEATFVGDPACCGRNIYYHTDSENFPFTGTTLAVHLARLVSVLFGVVTIGAVYGLARTIVPGDPLAAAAVTAVVAFNPTFLFSGALVSNDVPLAALCTLTLLVLVKLLYRQYTLGLKTAASLGVLIGLALLVKLTAIGLVPFAILVLLYVAWRDKEWRWALAGNGVMLAIVVVMTGWWFARNQLLYGDPLAYRLMSTSAIFPRAGPLTLNELFQISLPWLWQTFWGGPTSGDFAPGLLVILGVLAALALAGSALWIKRETKLEFPLSMLLLGAWLGFILIAQIQFIRTTIGADQGRYLFPAIGSIGLFFALGLRELGVYFFRRTTEVSHRVGSAISIAIIAMFVLLGLAVPFAYTIPAYARPALATETDIARIAHPLQADFAGRVRFLGYDVSGRSVKPGETLTVSLYWRGLAPMQDSYRVFVHLVGQGNRTAGGVDVIPARGAFPTVYWKPGDTLRDTLQIPVSTNAAPGKYSIEIGLYPVGKPGERLSVDGTSEDRIVVDAIKVAPSQPMVYNPPVQADANFADRARLIGYDTRVDEGVLALTLYWASRSPFNGDYKVFVHVLDQAGQIAAQSDQEPQAGNYPTSLWMVGDQIEDPYNITLPPGNANDYRIEIGMYLPDTGERLGVLDGSGKPQGDSYIFALEPK